MCEFLRPRSRFCVISAPGTTSMPYCLSARSGLGADVLEVVLEVLLAHAERPSSQRREPGGAGQQILLHQDVIGDRDDVELAGRAVQIHDLGHRQLPIAPLRVDVEVTQKKWLVPRHHSTPNSQFPTPNVRDTHTLAVGRWELEVDKHQILTSRCVVSFGRPCSSSDVKLRT